MTGARVLIVDDSSFARAVISESISTHGLQVVGEAADGIQALDLYRRLKPDVVTMDVSMPGLDGVTALRGIIEHDPRARIVVVSVAGQEDVVVQALQAGAIGFLLKPFEPTQLIELLRRTGSAEPRPQPDSERRRLYVLEAQRRIEALAEDVRDLAAAPGDGAILDSVRRHARALCSMAGRINDEPTRLVSDAIDRIAVVGRSQRGAAIGDLPSLLHDAVLVLQKLLLAASRGDDDLVHAETFRQRLDAGVQALRASGLTEDGPVRVLIVDPDPVARRIIEGFLLRDGFAVHVVDSFAEALDQAQQHAPSLVIVDADGVRIDGPIVVRRLREDPSTAHAAVLLITPRAELSQKLAAFAAGADDVIVKPFEPEEVVARAQALLARTRRARAVAETAG